MMEFLQQLFGPVWPVVWTLAKIVAIVAPIMGAVASKTRFQSRPVMIRIRAAIKR